MIEITKIKVLRNGSGAIGTIPVSIEVEDIEDFREEIRIFLDWRQKDEEQEDKI